MVGLLKPKIAGIAIFEKVGSKLFSGCGKRLDIFSIGSRITFKADVIEESVKEVTWCLANRQNPDQNSEKVAGGADYTTDFVVAVSDSYWQ